MNLSCPQINVLFSNIIDAQISATISVQMLWLRLTTVLLLPAVSLQLGKSDRKLKLEKKEKEKQTQKETEVEDSIQLVHPPASVTKQSVLEKHENVDYTERKFENAMLVYVTPWNSKGYDLAKWVSHKLTHVSPVWLQVKPQRQDMSFTCQILGTHDIDHEWMDDVRKNNSDVKIVPRVLFDGWQVEVLAQFLQNEGWMRRCGDDLINLLTRTQFDGAVVELWANAMVQTGGEAVELLIEMLRSWGDAFHKKNLQLIVPVGPPLNPENRPTGMFTAGFFFTLSEKVDYIQLMTYDYASKDMLGVAPYDWVDRSLATVLNKMPDIASQLMVGLNHYGYEYTGKNMQAVNFQQYIENLKKKDSKLEWDSKSKEHFIATGSSKIYYPSLTSIEMRLNIARKHGVSAAIWDFGQGLNYFTQLL
ncbi:unnamed protein product [Cylicocyclus nassatus]|uniref:Chitinase domain-containing protein 1 n=1 Tax=Cylicocyclus nassatus TaxID=53992 RepID=A0AA36HFS6_CYLNA|nr:unnamed protein product [Cylicocyclus nassatus]